MFLSLLAAVYGVEHLCSCTTWRLNCGLLVQVDDPVEAKRIRAKGGIVMDGGQRVVSHSLHGKWSHWLSGCFTEGSFESVSSSAPVTSLMLRRITVAALLGQLRAPPTWCFSAPTAATVLLWGDPLASVMWLYLQVSSSGRRSLNMSRSLGDPDYKTPHRIVSSRPDVRTVTLRCTAFRLGPSYHISAGGHRCVIPHY